MNSSEITKRLLSIDPSFTEVALRFPNCPLLIPNKSKLDPFASLVSTIISQQLSGKAAKTISERVEKEFEIDPLVLANTTTEALRALGLSAAKVRAIKELSKAINSNIINISELKDLPQECIRTTLTKIWGIGDWTVDMFLMFEIKELDVWPIKDLGVQKGWQLLHELPTRPTPDQLMPLGEPLLGIRSLAAWYCWRALEL